MIPEAEDRAREAEAEVADSPHHADLAAGLEPLNEWLDGLAGFGSMQREYLRAGLMIGYWAGAVHALKLAGDD